MGRGIFACMCALGGGLQFLLAPVLTFGWTSNVVCANNATCAFAMSNAAAAAKSTGDGGGGVVCCADYAADPTVQCNQATYRILFIVTAVVYPFALCLALVTALLEKSKFHGKMNGRQGKALIGAGEEKSRGGGGEDEVEEEEESELDSSDGEDGESSSEVVAAL